MSPWIIWTAIIAAMLAVTLLNLSSLGLQSL